MLSNEEPLLNVVSTMKDEDTSLHNYIIAGLTSTRLKGVRLFEQGRTQVNKIAPHSHRYDFSCIVLKGDVVNHIWTPSTDKEDDLFMVSFVDYKGEPGKYHKEPRLEPERFSRSTTLYSKGAVYSMQAAQIHSIDFSKGAVVLFFEGAVRDSMSVMLEPYDEKTGRIPLGITEGWMFT